MSKTPEGSFDPAQKFAGVRQQQGRVQQDSDWNEPERPRRVSSRGRWALIAAGGVVAVGALALLGFVLLARRASSSAHPLAVLARPRSGLLVPLHSTLPAVGEGRSDRGIARLELWVNGQRWSSADFDPAPAHARQVWSWTPSGEGEHLLFVRAFDARGGQADSPLARVLASAQADVRFPVAHTVAAGETLESLAATYGADPESILGANPGLDPGALPAGEQVMVPMPMPNAPPAAPESGEPPAPPHAAPVDEPGGQGALPGNVPDAAGEAPLSPGLEAAGGRIIPGIPMQLLYVYLSVDGGPWGRLPADPDAFLHPAADGSFDLNPYLNALAAAGPVTVDYRAWGWSGGALTYLGEGSWTLSDPNGAHSLYATELDILGRVRDSFEYAHEWTIPMPIEGYFHGFVLDFRWKTALEGVDTMLWQVSTQPFPQQAGLFTPGMVGSGPAGSPFEGLMPDFDLGSVSTPFGSFSLGVGGGSPGDERGFALDFANYVDTSAWEQQEPEAAGGGFFGALADALSSAWESVTGAAGGAQGPEFVRVSSGALPRTFYVRLVPVMEGGGLGEPSNTVIVRFGPPPPPEVTSDLAAAYDARVLSFTHYRAADPAYAGCMVSTQELRSCWNVFGLPDGLVYSGAVPPALQSVYQSSCSLALPQGSLGCGCPGVSCSSGGSSCSWSPTDWGSCIQEGAEWFVEAVKDASNWASETWEWLKEQAVYVMLNFTPLGWTCQLAADQADDVVSDDFCHTAMKLALETGMASLGIPPSLPNFKELVEHGREYAFQLAVQELRDLGVECDSICEEALRAGYDYALDNIGTGGGGGGGAGVPMQLYVPHPLANEQPFSLLVRVTRRIDSAGVPDENLARCGLSLYPRAVRGVGGMLVEGEPYEALGLDLPVLPPGGAVNVPVILQRSLWALPPGVPAEAVLPPGVVLGALIDPATGLSPEPDFWPWLYPGSSLAVQMGGPYFLFQTVDGHIVGAPCVAPAEETIQIPN